MKNRIKVLIIGGGFAGLSCAKKFAGNKRFQVTLIDRQNHHLFQPLLYQVATSALSAVDISRSIRQVLSKADNVTVILDQIDRIDEESRVAKSKTKRYDYDYLVIATGVQTSFFGNDQWKYHVVGLKSLSDAYQIRKRFLNALETAERINDQAEREKLMSIVIVGGGPTGVELAGAYADLVTRTLQSDYKRIKISEIRIIVIEAAPRLLMPFAEKQSAYTKKRLEKLGVDVRLKTRVTDVQNEYVEIENTESIKAHTIIWAAGMQATPFLKSLSFPKDKAGCVKVEKDLSLKNHPEIFVVGDAANVTDSKSKRLPGVAPAATQMGEYVASLIEKEKGTVATQREPFNYFDKGMMAIIGKNAAVVKMGRLQLKGISAWVVWLLVHILFLIGFRNKLSVLLGWAYAYIGSKPEARVYTADDRE